MPYRVRPLSFSDKVKTNEVESRKPDEKERARAVKASVDRARRGSDGGRKLPFKFLFLKGGRQMTWLSDISYTASIMDRNVFQYGEYCVDCKKKNDFLPLMMNCHMTNSKILAKNRLFSIYTVSILKYISFKDDR